MFAKYLNSSPSLSIIYLVGLALFIPQFFCSNTTCPPPHFPERGGYEPKKTEYEVGQTVAYYCNSSILFFVKDDDLYAAKKEVTCQFGGKWSGGTPFCAVTENMKVTKENLTVFDDNLSTCYEIQSGSKGILGFYLDREASAFVAIVCFGKGAGSFHISFRSTNFGRNYNADQVNEKCRVLDLREPYSNKTNYIAVEVSTNPNSSIEVCEVLVYMKDDVWCEHPPETFVPNGHLEVSRNRAVLHCHEGFKEKDGKSVHAICTNDSWSILNLMCIGEQDEWCEPLPEISVPNGRLEVIRNKAVLHCNEGFMETENREVYATCGNNIWSFSNLQCVEKNDEWCEPLPEISVPNGHLEVSRNKVALQCNDGFKEKDGKDAYAICDNNKWIFLSLQCVEKNAVSYHEIFCGPVVDDISHSEGEWESDGEMSEYPVGTKRTLNCKPGYQREGQPSTITCLVNGTWESTAATCKKDTFQVDHKILDIVIGSIAAIIIIVLIGVIIFLISKKPEVASVKYEHYENAIPSACFRATKGPDKEGRAYVNIMRQTKTARRY